MKILWVTDNFLPHLGGSRIIYWNLLKRLPGEAFLLTKRVPGWREFDAASGIPTRRYAFRKLSRGSVPVREGPLYAEILWVSVCCSLLWNPDLLFCGELLPTGLAGLAVRLLQGRPYVLYLHGEELSILKGMGGERRLAERVLRGAGAVLCSDRSALLGALDWGVEERRLHLLLPGIDDRFLKSRGRGGRFRKRLGLEGKRILLSVGRLVERKGHDRVIGLMPELLRGVADLVYLIVGEGPRQKELLALASRLGVSERVLFAGRVSEADLPQAYRSCDVFVQPNRELEHGDTEGFGIVFLEAAASGRPVIGGRAGGLEESIVEGVTGFRVEGEEELKSAILKLLRDTSLARRMGGAGRRRVLREFRWDERVAAFRAICDGVLSKGGG